MPERSQFSRLFAGTYSMVEDGAGATGSPEEQAASLAALEEEMARQQTLYEQLQEQLRLQEADAQLEIQKRYARLNRTPTGARTHVYFTS